MNPIIFICEETMSLAPEAIGRQILDVTKWSDFNGYGPMLGIKLADFEFRSPGIVGSRIRVTNRDGSSHIEEIVEWEPDRHLRLEMKEFSAPLSWLTSGFEETWAFERTGNETHVTRSFRLHAKSLPARLPLRAISFFLKRPIARHLRQMGRGALSQCR